MGDNTTTKSSDIEEFVTYQVIINFDGTLMLPPPGANLENFKGGPSEVLELTIPKNKIKDIKNPMPGAISVQANPSDFQIRNQPKGIFYDPKEDSIYRYESTSSMSESSGSDDTESSSETEEDFICVPRKKVKPSTQGQSEVLELTIPRIEIKDIKYQMSGAVSVQANPSDFQIRKQPKGIFYDPREDGTFRYDNTSSTSESSGSDDTESSSETEEDFICVPRKKVKPSTQGQSEVLELTIPRIEIKDIKYQMPGAVSVQANPSDFQIRKQPKGIFYDRTEDSTFRYDNTSSTSESSGSDDTESSSETEEDFICVPRKKVKPSTQDQPVTGAKQSST